MACGQVARTTGVKMRKTEMPVDGCVVGVITCYVTRLNTVHCYDTYSREKAFYRKRVLHSVHPTLLAVPRIGAAGVKFVATP